MNGMESAVAIGSDVHKEVVAKLEEYEGRASHFYLDSVGKVTVGVGHMILNRTLVARIQMCKGTAAGPGQAATFEEKQQEYDRIAAQPRGYKASWYEKHAILIMRESEINSLRDHHIAEFYGELTRIYSRARGCKSDFDQFPKAVQLALFDMIFNLGAKKLVSTFVQFDRRIREANWSKAAEGCSRTQVSASRNEYVRKLLLGAGAGK